jgi:hypothetical protein
MNDPSESETSLHANDHVECVRVYVCPRSLRGVDGDEVTCDAQSIGNAAVRTMYGTTNPRAHGFIPSRHHGVKRVECPCIRGPSPHRRRDRGDPWEYNLTQSFFRSVFLVDNNAIQFPRRLSRRECDQYGRILGIGVRLLLVYKNMDTLWKLFVAWNGDEVYKSLRWIGGAVVLYRLYCMTIGTSANPLMCFVKIW